MHIELLTSVRGRSLVLARKVNILICTKRCGDYSESALIISVNKTGVRVQACLDVYIFLNDRSSHHTSILKNSVSNTARKFNIYTIYISYYSRGLIFE